MPVPEHREIQKRAICQGDGPASFESPRANPRKWNIRKVKENVGEAAI